MRPECKKTNCDHCNKEFMQKKHWQRFCGKDCRKAENNARVVSDKDWQEFKQWREQQKAVK